MADVNNNAAESVNDYVLRYYNNYTILKSNRNIENKDLEFVNLFFENPKLSGGTDTNSHLYNPQTYNLCLNYKINECKEEILRRQKFTYRSYSFTSTQKDLLMSQFDKLNRAIILSNIDITNEDLSVVELYAEYLVPDNSIVNLTISKIVPNTYYIEFKDEFNFDTVLKRYKKRQQLRQIPIYLYEAFNTNVLLLDLKLNFNQEKLENYLDERFNNGTKSYWQLPFKKRNPIAFITINDDSYMKKVLNLKDKIDGQQVVLEKCYNFKLIDMYIDEHKTDDYNKNSKIEVPVVHANKNTVEAINRNNRNMNFVTENYVQRKDTIDFIDRILGMKINKAENAATATSVISSNTFGDQSEIESENTEDWVYDDTTAEGYDEVKDACGVNDDEFIFHFEDDDPFYDILLNCDKIIDDFNKYLTGCNAVCVNASDEDDDDYLYINRKRKGTTETHEEWLGTLNKFIEEFWSKKLICRRIKVPDELLDRLDVVETMLTKLNELEEEASLSVQHKSDNECNIGVVGYHQAATNCIHRVSQELTLLKNNVANSNVTKPQPQSMPSVPLPSSSINIQNLPRKLLDFDANEANCVTINPIDSLHHALVNCPNILIEFNKSLKGSAATAVIDTHGETNQKVVNIVSNKVLSQCADPWAKKVKSTLHNFYSKNISFTQTNLPKKLQSEAKIEMLKKRLSEESPQLFAHINFMKMQLSLVGFTTVVKQIRSEIEDASKEGGFLKAKVVSSDAVAVCCNANPVILNSLKNVVRDKRTQDFAIHLNPYLLTSIALKHCKFLLNIFQNLLDPVDAKIRVCKDLIISPKANLGEKKLVSAEWQTKVYDVVDKFYNNKVQRCHMEIPKSLQTTKGLDRINTKCVDLMNLNNEIYIQIDRDKYFVRVCGLRNKTESVFSKVKQALFIMEKEIIQEISKIANRNHPLLSIKLNHDNEPKLKVLYHFDDKYYNTQFKPSLEKLNAFCIRSPKEIEIISYKLDNNSCLIEIEKWRDKIFSFIQKFIAQFSIQKFAIPLSWQNHIPKTNNVIICVNNWDIEVCGREEDVKEFIKKHKE